jgi:hypothetical protein
MFVTAGLSLAGPASAQMYSHDGSSMPMSKASYSMAKTNADAQYKADRHACESRSGNAEDICETEAKGKANVSKADAKATYENTAQARESARVAKAEAIYGVAIEKCDDLAGNGKDVCVKEAKAVLVKGKADAKVDRVATDTRSDAATKQADARKEANEDILEAKFKLAIEKCDALAGAAKDGCVKSAKAQYNKV